METLRASQVYVLVSAPTLLVLALALLLLAPEMLHSWAPPWVLAGALLAQPAALLAMRRQRRTGRPQSWWSIWATLLMASLTLCVVDPLLRQATVLAVITGPLYAAMFTGRRSVAGHVVLALALTAALARSASAPLLENVFQVAAVEVVMAFSIMVVHVMRRHLGVAIHSAEAAQARADHLADHDPLTGLLNRRGLHGRLPAPGPIGPTGPMGAVLLDVDHFKAINDRLGHAAGDEVLVRVAAVLAATVRVSDLLARVGGEEFLVITTGDGANATAHLAERLRAAVAADQGVPAVTVSAGVALCGPGVPCLLDELNAQADVLLYLAKAEGRNRVRVQNPA